MPLETTAASPELSVVVPTYGRPEILAQLLDAIDRQTLAPERLEVVVVDDGTEPPIEIDAARHAYAIRLLRQANAGPGAARNLAFEHARAPLVLILNDDAVPAPDLFAGHLAAQASAPPRTAILGAFPFTARSLRSPFVRLLAQTNLLFDYARMKDREHYGWRSFWTCNISLPLAALRSVGGFDGERFREAICEDVELGYRLEKKGWRVQYRADLVCEHEHVVTPRAYFRRAVRLGANSARIHAKHAGTDLFPLGGAHPGPTPNWRASAQGTIEAFHDVQLRFVERLEALERTPDVVHTPAQSKELADLTQRLALIPVYRGWLQELEGHDPAGVIENGATPGRLTSVIVVSYDALEKTRNCIEALRRTADPRHPTQIVVVDNGSRDGSAEWLAAQSDLTLVANTENAGAPRARNQGLAHSHGEFVAFLDNDVVVSQGWLARLLYHAEVDGQSGCVGPVTNRAGHGQEVPWQHSREIPDLERFSAERAIAHRRKFRFQTLMTSFCMLVRRAVVDEIGGFDERFSPWGFEDDDFSMRAALAGFRNRVALDVFVRHDHYGGAKLKKHEELLARNWSRFAQKWCGDGTLPYGDYPALQPAMRRAFTRADYHVSLVEPPPTLPTKDQVRQEIEA